MSDNPFKNITDWEQYADGADQYKKEQDDKEQERREIIDRAWALRFENDMQDLY